MYLKRPSFRRGGNTGIISLTPRVNAKFGFGFLKGGGDKLFPQTINRSGLGQGIDTIISKGMMETISGGENRIPLRGAPFIAKAGAVAAPVAAISGLAYLNRPKTLAAKKFMQEYGPLDETISEEELKSYYEQIDRLNKVGDEISFADAIFMDPKTGTYPFIFGRTEDRDIKRKLEAEEKEQAKVIDEDIESIGEGPGEALPPTGDLNILDRVLAEADKKAQVRADKDKDTKADSSAKKDITKEDSFESIYEKELKKIENLIGKSKDTNKGEIALALSEAVGTEGTLADKASVLNKFLLGKIAKDKKSERDIALLAYATVSDLRKAQIAAGKKDFSERKFNEYANLASKKDRTQSEESRFQILKDALGIKTGLTGPSATAAGRIANEINSTIVELQTATPEMQKELQSEIIAGINQLLLIQGITKDNVSGIIGFDVSNYLANGGRVNKAMGSPQEGETVETIKESITMTGETPAAPVQKLTYNELRNRLPKEITDDIVALIANSEQALQDFAYIRTQGDVDSFNVKYGMNLVLPQTA